MITDELARRLLAAADNTYYRDPEAETPGLKAVSLTREAEAGYLARPEMHIDGPVYAWKPPFNGLLTEDVTAFARRDAATVGVTASEIIVAFRGTLPFPGAETSAEKILVSSDWINDLDVAPVKRPPVPGLVHPGFAQALDNVWDEVKTALKPLLAAYPTLPICFTGHSKGGAMAQIGAVRYRAEGGDRAIYCCTFASARAGDATFIAAFKAAVKDNSRRYEYGDDVVPHLPPSSVGVYRSAGTLFYLPTLAEGAAAVGSPKPGPETMARAITVFAALGATAGEALAAKFTGGTPKQLPETFVGVHHAIDPGSGYHRWICR